MRVEQISSIQNSNKYKKQTDSKKEITTQAAQADGERLLRSKFNDHMVAFKARVDKGLNRFYETNKDRMPVTVKRYVGSLEDKSLLTPLQAQQRAFLKLNDAKNASDIKKYFEGEELFEELIEPENSKATRGILQSFKENAELLALSGESILKDNSDFTVYLVKKVFLEAKTIDEINKDLENDLNEDFKNDFKFKNPGSKYVYGSTLKALGIKTPPFEYQQSLRYTRDGYSDIVGENISQAQRKFWDSLSPEERTARAKKSVEKFEAWWNSFTNNQKLDLIADQLSALDLLKDFKKQQRKETKNQPDAINETENPKPKQHTKVGSSKLSQDELFVRWATNNLKLFEANLSEAEKDTLHLKRMQRLVDRWTSMTPAEKTDYISKMKAGSEPLRYTMIDAWNHSLDLIKDLSLFLREKHVYKPADLLYSTEQFSQFQSEIMSEFWENHRDYSIKLGNNIRASQEKINAAITRGTFEELKKQIMRDKNQRLKELAKLLPQKQNKQKPDVAPKAQNVDKRPDYMNDFMALYSSHGRLGVSDMPEEYWEDFFDTIQEAPEDFVRIWTKQLKGEYVSQKEEEFSAKIRTTETPKSARISRAIETAMAFEAYNCVKDPTVFKLSTTDLKTILYNIQHGAEVVRIKSHQLNEFFEFPVKSRKIDPKNIAKRYHIFKEDVDESVMEEVKKNYFDAGEKSDELEAYLNTYGKALTMLFSVNNNFSIGVKKALYEKFKNRMPENLKDVPCYFDVHGIEYEDKISQAKIKCEQKYDYVPKHFIEKYFNEIAGQLRTSDNITADEFANQACKIRKNTSEHIQMAVFPKTNLQVPVRLYTLAVEQALADILYEATGNVDVYQMQFEELCNNIELFRLVKKFPSENRHYESYSLKKTVDISAKKRLNLSKIKELINEYINNVGEWINEEGAVGGTSQENIKPADLEELLYALNPDENMPEKDKAVIKRILNYGLKLKLNPPVEPHIAEAVAEG